MINKQYLWFLIAALIVIAGYFVAIDKIKKMTKKETEQEQKNDVIKKIDLSDHSHNTHGPVAYMPHNVQVAPDGKSVWVAANAVSTESHNEKQSLLPFVKTALADEGHGVETATDDDQLIVISPETDEIVKRISIGKGLSLAHVVLSPDSSFALTTAQKTSEVYRVNAATFEVGKNIAATEGSAPHGIVVPKDRKFVYVTNLLSGDVSVIDTATDAEIAKIAIGEEPNGISLWSKTLGGTQ